jgi:hypothetical protein
MLNHTQSQTFKVKTICSYPLAKDLTGLINSVLERTRRNTNSDIICWKHKLVQSVWRIIWKYSFKLVSRLMVINKQQKKKIYYWIKIQTYTCSLTQQFCFYEFTIESCSQNAQVITSGIIAIVTVIAWNLWRSQKGLKYFYNEIYQPTEKMQILKVQTKF